MNIGKHVVSSLRSNHEEPNIRLILHAKHAAATHNNVIIKSPDTDVLIISIATQQRIENVMFGNRCRCLSVSTIADKLVVEVSHWFHILVFGVTMGLQQLHC